MATTVLFVDDDPNALSSLKRSFHREAFQIYTASCAAQALSLLEKHAIDVVVTDEKMPAMSGSELLAIVRRRYPDVIRIILSGQAAIENSIHAISKGDIYRFLLKPCSPSLIALTIRYALLQKRQAATKKSPPEEKNESPQIF